MSAFKWFASVSLAAVMLPVLHAEPHCPGNVASLRLRLVERSIIVVPVLVNHSGPYDFMVDTGAQLTTVDPSLASELHLKMLGTTGVVSVSVSARASYTRLELVEAGAHAVEDSLTVVQDLGQLRAIDPRVRGILGANFLEHFDVMLDYGQRILCLDDARVMQSKVKGERISLVTPEHPERYLPFTEPPVEVVHLSGVETRQLLFRLDSGTNAPLLYDGGKLSGRAGRASVALQSRGTDGVERAFRVLPPQDIRLGNHSLLQVPLVTPNSTGGDVPNIGQDGLLPTGLFQRVFLSYADRYAVLDPW